MTLWDHGKTYRPQPDPASKKHALTIYGRIAQMLVEGGQRDPDGPERIYMDQDHKPRKQRQVECYPGEITYEPDPNVSDLKSTWTLICFMVRRGWTVFQINAELWDRANVGGEFYRFEVLYSADSGEGFLQRMVESAYPVPANSGSSPYSPSLSKAIGGTSSDSNTRSNSINSKSSGETWRTNDRGFVLREADAMQLVEWIAEAEGAERYTSRITEGGPLHPKVAGSYLKMLEERGIITRTEQVVHTARGRRISKVVSMTPKGPTDLADRRLWKRGQEAAERPWEQEERETSEEMWERLLNV